MTPTATWRGMPCSGKVLDPPGSRRERPAALPGLSARANNLAFALGGAMVAISGRSATMRRAISSAISRACSCVALYPCPSSVALLKVSKQPDAARAMMAFMISPEAGPILRKTHVEPARR